MQTMRAIGYTANLPVTDPDCLVQRDIDVPGPGPNDLLVEVRAVSVNPVDVKQRAGAPAGPDGFRILGFDAAGVVREIGEDVVGFSAGDEVFYAGDITRPGTDAQLHLVDYRIAAKRPANVSWEEAASLPLTSLTAAEALFDQLGLNDASSGTLLVIGATGGVGVAMLQLAEALLPNVRVIATASGAEAEETVKALGAEATVDHHGDLESQVVALAPEGVDWLFTSHSEGQIPLYSRIVRPLGAICAIDDGASDVLPLKAKCISWHWEFMFARSMWETPDMGRQGAWLTTVASLVEDRHLKPVVEQALSPISVETLREAHRLVETGHVKGKVVVGGGWS